MKKLLIIVLGMLSFTSFAQVEEAKPYAETITIDDLKDYLQVLASDALEGRETGERGQKMAAAFISNHFEKWGLQAPVTRGAQQSFYQNVPLYVASVKNVDLQVAKQTFKNFEDFVYYGQYAMDQPKSGSLVFASVGTPEVFNNIDAKGKSVVVYANDDNYRQKVTAANAAGAEMIFVVRHDNQQEFSTMAQRFQHYLSEGRLSLDKPERKIENKGVFFVGPEFVSKAFGTTVSKLADINKQAEAGKYAAVKKIKPVDLTYKVTMDVKEVKSENVLGYLPGTDLKDELVVLTAHYDHVGVDGEQVYNGADDDGSGTAAVMEIAEAFVAAAENGDRPRRSLLFMLVTAEEKGLLGSQYYTDKDPIFPLANTVVNLNIDMIGRIDPKHEENPDYVYLVGSDRLSTELHEISEKINEETLDLDLDYTYNDENHKDRIYYRSDHWNFAKNNIPIIFYFNGVHADYHKPSDTVDKIEWEQLKKRTHLVFYTAWELANKDKRLVVDKLPAQGSR